MTFPPAAPTVSHSVAIDVQSSYIDIGDWRIQTGITGNFDGSSFISLPALFADDNYTISGAMEAISGFSAGGGTVDPTYWIVSNSKKVNGFILDRDNDIDGAIYNWVAIGKKPQE